MCYNVFLMSAKCLRVFQKLDLNDIKKHLIVYGDLSASCENCQEVSIPFGSAVCPGCKTEFKYAAFRNIKHHLPKVYKLFEERPSLVIVDYDDFKKAFAAKKAEDLLK